MGIFDSPMKICRMQRDWVRTHNLRRVRALLCHDMGRFHPMTPWRSTLNHCVESQRDKFTGLDLLIPHDVDLLLFEHV